MKKSDLFIGKSPTLNSSLGRRSWTRRETEEEEGGDGGACRRRWWWNSGRKFLCSAFFSAAENVISFCPKIPAHTLRLPCIMTKPLLTPAAILSLPSPGIIFFTGEQRASRVRNWALYFRRCESHQWGSPPRDRSVGEREDREKGPDSSWEPIYGDKKCVRVCVSVCFFVIMSAMWLMLEY